MTTWTTNGTHTFARGRWAGLSAAVAGLLLAAAGGTARAQFGPSPVEVSKVLYEEVAPAQEYVGSIGPTRRAVIGSAVDGRVSEFAVNEGDRVEVHDCDGDGLADFEDCGTEEAAEGGAAGTEADARRELTDEEARDERREKFEKRRARGKLAQILTSTISDEIESAEAELAFRRRKLEELETRQPLQEKQAEARVKVAELRQEFADSRLERARKLVQRGAITQDQLDEFLTNKEEADELAIEARQKLALVRGPQKQQIEQARQQVRMQEAVVGKLKDQRMKHTIVTRFTGYVVAEHTEAGAWVNRGDPVAEVVALDEVDVLVNVLENHVQHLRRGQEVSVTVPAVGQVFPGTVQLIVPQADSKARTFPVKVRVKNELIEGESSSAEGGTPVEEDGSRQEPLLKSGMLARVNVPLGRPRPAYLVSKDALVLGGPSEVVYVVDGSGESAKARAVNVEVGVASGRLIAVRGDLSKDDLVIVRGNERLRPGQSVVVTKTLDPGAEPAAKAIE